MIRFVFEKLPLRKGDMGRKEIVPERSTEDFVVILVGDDDILD